MHKHTTHFEYGSGMAGCLYDSGPYYVETKTEAINSLLVTFLDLAADELRNMKRILTTDSIYWFRNSAEAGADYCEVVEQDGPCPEGED